MTGRNVDLILGMKMNDFLDANQRAYVEYSKTKSRIEKNPVNMQVKGGRDFDMMSMRIASVGNAFQSLGSEVKPVINLLSQTNMSAKGLSQAFVGLSDVGLRTFQMVSILRVGVNGLQASLGPIGWLMIGITAVSTAFSLFSSSGDEATDTAKNFSKELNRPDFLPDWLVPEKLAKSFGIGALVKQQKIALDEMQKAAEQNNMTAYDKAKKYYDDVTALVKKYSDLASVAATGLTVKEVEELNKKTAAQQKYSNMVVDLEKKVGDVVTKEQDRITADFKKETKERTRAEEVAVNKREGFTDKTEKLYDFMGEKGLAVSGLLESAFINQFQNGVPAMVAFGRAFEQMLAQMAISLASRAIIFGFLNMITGGSFGIGRSLLGFMGLGEVSGKASGGRITSSDIARSAFTPSGEDGLIGVQVGETVINRRATQMFAPVLDKLNDMGRYGYAKGGTVADNGMMPNTGFNNQGLYDIVDAIRNIQINIKSDLDAISFLRENYPRYQRVINKNRI